MRATTVTALASLLLGTAGTVGLAPAQAGPQCAPGTVRLTAVSTDATQGTITGSPAGGGAPITLSGPLDAYRKSEGFGDNPPPAVKQWDDTLDQVTVPIAPDDPNWYGRAKSRAFASRSLNDLAVSFPANTLVVHYWQGDPPGAACAMSSIQPVAP
ncbi:hypothetical protein [Mycobacterium aquaticum]|uniref:Uncharacterized protein n=1 Tax=Mycobacterium aquaticum TaxID=1927124 RepID=A0A1W9ZYI4_9MYCO|nr:hypothetical protein [Mycobacterium aquaticum]ORA22785.1 hypothetical protein BST13_36005 [Mycobacterium aquaticum]